MEPFPVPDTESKFTTSFYDRVSDWVLAVAGDTLRVSDRAGDRYTAEVLAGVVFQLALDHGDRWISERSTRDRISEQSLWNLCEKKSRWLVRTFRPALTKAQMSKGGKRSKRRSHLLELFRSLDPTLSITEAAEALHCHPRTVSKLRARVAAEQEAADLAVLESIDVPEREIPVDELWASMGLVRLTDGRLVFPDSDPITLDRVLEGIAL